MERFSLQFGPVWPNIFSAFHFENLGSWTSPLTYAQPEIALLVAVQHPGPFLRA